MSEEIDAEAAGEIPGTGQMVGARSAESMSSAFVRLAGMERHDEQTLMERVIDWDNIQRAYNRVKGNKGSPGVDGMTVEELGVYFREQSGHVREQLLQGTYRPKPVKGVQIPKPDGGKRQLGIPTVLDRTIQQAICQVIEPGFDGTFSDSSFGFRRRRSAHDALLKAREYVAEGRRWVVDIDIEKFFDRVNHDILMAKVAKRVHDKRVLKLIRLYLQAGLMQDGLCSQRQEGTPQGGPLSPLLSNIMLDTLDKELEKRVHCFCRYADDCNIYVRSKKAAKRVFDSIKHFLETKLKLKINETKSQIGRPWKLKFLGYTMTHHKTPKLKPHNNVVKRFRVTMKKIFRMARGWSYMEIMEAIKPKIRGMAAYFVLTDTKATWISLDEWLRHRIRLLILRRWKRPKTIYKNLIRRGISEELAKEAAGSDTGPWRNSHLKALNYAFPNQWLMKHGLMSLLMTTENLRTRKGLV